MASAQLSRAPADAFGARIDAALALVEAHGAPLLAAASGPEGAVAARAVGGFGRAGVPALDVQIDLLELSKSATAILTLWLIERGEFQLETRLIDLLPDAPPEKTEITIDQLLSHRSGLPDRAQGADGARDADALIARALAAPSHAAPGDAYAYSSLGYRLLAALIERALGAPFDTVLARMLATAGAEAMGYLPALHPSRAAAAADGRALTEASWSGPKPHWGLFGASGMVASPRAFFAFRRALAAGELIGAAALRRAQTAITVDAEGPGNACGYGVMIETSPRHGDYLCHNGANPAFAAFWARFDAADVELLLASGAAEGDDLPVAAAILADALC